MTFYTRKYQTVSLFLQCLHFCEIICNFEDFTLKNWKFYQNNRNIILYTCMTSHFQFAMTQTSIVFAIIFFTFENECYIVSPTSLLTHLIKESFVAAIKQNDLFFRSTQIKHGTIWLFHWPWSHPALLSLWCQCLIISYIVLQHL